MNNYDSKRIIESRGGICEFFDCDRLATEVHHKDKDRENNNPENLQILCNPCHSRLHGKEGNSGQFLKGNIPWNKGLRRNRG